MEVTVLNRQRRVRVNTAWLANVARQVLARVSPPGRAYEVAVVLVSDARIRTLNRRYRGLDAATDVLAFPLEHPAHLGDVVISVETARRQARRLRHSLTTELARLLIHGLLHLRGYDHTHRDSRRHSKRSASKARRMRRVEAALWRVVIR